MSLTPNAHSTARRNLAQRIDRLLREQVGLPKPTLSDWQANQVFVAIELLDAEQFSDGEHIMMKAEKADVFEPAGYKPAVRHGVRQLLDRLERRLAR